MSNEQQAAPVAAQAPQFNERQWNQEQYARALKYCADKGLRVGRIDQRSSRVLPPFVALWQVSVLDYSDKLWILTGDLPADHVTTKAAPTARDALRHFSLNWQMKAENLVADLNRGRVSLGSPEGQMTYARMLVSRAQSMYGMAEDESLWQKA